MNKGKLRRTLFTLLTFVMASVLVVASACTPSEVKLVEGILQNVDSVNGEITIVTEDGRTITLTIATEAQVETEGATSALEALEPGVSVEVEVNDDGQVAQHIKARLAKVEGVIVGIEGNEVTVESERGRRVTVLVTDRTRIELEEDFPGTLADLRVGAEVEVKFDPESRVAFKVDTEEEEAEIEGIIVQIDGNEVTIETERGHRRTLIVGDQTRIELEDDFPGIMADLQVGIEVEANFDPFTRLAFKIEVEEITPTTLPAGMGTIEIRVTDAPPKYTVTRILVEISEDGEEGGVQVHRVDGEGGGEWETIDILGGKNPFVLYPDLLGLEQVLAVGGVDAGKYTQIRMNLESVTVTYTYTEDGETQEKTVEAIIPNGELKFVRPFYVEEGGKTTITLDFDADKSVAVTGAPDKVIFKPVVKLSIEYGEGEKEEEEELLGTIAGTVTDSGGEPIEGANVVVEDTELSTTTDDDGDYEITDVPEATYTVTASAAGYDDNSQSVTVIAGETSTADFALP